MLKRDVLTKNIAVLFNRIQEIAGLKKDDPNKALEMIERNQDMVLLNKLYENAGDLRLFNDQLVKAQIDLYYHKADILLQENREEGLAAFEKVRILLDHYTEAFPRNFPFDFFQKKAHTDAVLKENKA